MLSNRWRVHDFFCWLSVQVGDFVHFQLVPINANFVDVSNKVLASNDEFIGHDTKRAGVAITKPWFVYSINIK
jgi:hypothetical protein